MLSLLKNCAKWSLQRLLGFQGYLLLFSLFKIITFRWDRAEGEAFSHFLNLLPRKGIIIDAGANIGIMTALFSRQFPQAVVHAFEPMPPNYKALSRVVGLLRCKNVILHPAGLGAHEQMVRMRLPIVGGINQQGISHVLDGRDVDHSGHDYTVQLTTIDQQFPESDQPVVGIKVDVEDYERHVFEGGMGVLRRDHPWIYAELWESENREACFRLLEPIGYTPWVWDRAEKNLVPFDGGGRDALYFFFKPPEVGTEAKQSA